MLTNVPEKYQLDHNNMHYTQQICINSIQHVSLFIIYTHVYTHIVPHFHAMHAWNKIIYVYDIIFKFLVRRNLIP